MLFSTSKEISFPLHLKNAVRMSEQFFILQVSAAEGAEEFYITSNNHTRMEPVEQARKLDRITQQVSCNVSVKSKRGGWGGVMLKLRFDRYIMNTVFYNPLHATAN